MRGYDEWKTSYPECYDPIYEDVKCMNCEKYLEEDHDLYKNPYKYNNMDDHDDDGNICVLCNKCDSEQEKRV